MRKFLVLISILLSFVFAFSYKLDKGKVLNNDLFASNEDVVINGVLNGDLTLINGNLIVSGKVKGDIAVINGIVVLKKNSKICKNILVVAGNLKRDKSSEIKGEIFLFNPYKETISSFFNDPIKFLFTYSYSFKDKNLLSNLITSFAIFLLMLLIVVFFPENIEKCVSFIKNNRVKFVKYSFLYYFLILLLIFISLLLSAIYIGIIFLIIFLILFVIALIFGKAVIFIYLGNLFIRKNGKFVLKLLTGNFFYLILNFIPGMAILSHIFLQIASIGVSISTKFGKK